MAIKIQQRMGKALDLPPEKIITHRITCLLYSGKQQPVL